MGQFVYLLLLFLPALLLIPQVSFAPQDDLYTAALKDEVEFASPILQTGFITTGSDDYSISNQYDIRHIRAGELMRISGLTVEGFPFYALHKYDFGDVTLTGKILIDDNYRSLSSFITAAIIEPEENIIEQISVKALVSYPHHTYWRESLIIDVKVFEEDSNIFNNYWSTSNLVPNVPISMIIKHEQGAILATIEGVTNEKGYFQANHFVTENISAGGKYIVSLQAGNHYQEFETYIRGEVPRLRDNSTNST